MGCPTAVIYSTFSYIALLPKTILQLLPFKKMATTVFNRYCKCVTKLCNGDMLGCVIPDSRPVLTWTFVS